LTCIGPRLPPPEDDVVQAGGRGVFLDYEGDAEHYVVEFENAVFCCAADDVHPDPGRRCRSPADTTPPRWQQRTSSTPSTLQNRD